MEKKILNDYNLDIVKIINERNKTNFQIIPSHENNNILNHEKSDKIIDTEIYKNITIIFSDIRMNTADANSCLFATLLIQQKYLIGQASLEVLNSFIFLTAISLGYKITENVFKNIEMLKNIKNSIVKKEYEKYKYATFGKYKLDFSRDLENQKIFDLEKKIGEVFLFFITLSRSYDFIPQMYLSIEEIKSRGFVLSQN